MQNVFLTSRRLKTDLEINGNLDDVDAHAHHVSSGCAIVSCPSNIKIFK
jgi:hypothetical protein